MIFISYSWKDKAKVDKVYQILKIKYGAEKIFFDSEQNKLGDDYWLNIEKGLKTCNYFIFFNSPNYKRSSSCGNELLTALELQDKIRILEIKLDNSTISHPSLTRKIYLLYETANKVAENIIETIENKSFSGFVLEPIIWLERAEFDKKNNILNIFYKVKKNIFSPSLIFIYNSNIEVPNKIDFNLDILHERTGKYKEEFYCTIGSSLQSKLSNDKEYKASIANFSQQEKYLFGILDPDKGDETKLDNYIFIFSQNLNN